MADAESITLDGRLDEDVWMRAVPATNFIQLDPNNGQPATEQTEVRIVYDADKLYMGVTLFDSEPDKLIYYQMGRDGNLPADDKLQWAIDTFNDGRTAYWWEMNPLGSMADALRGANNTNNRQWDGIWDARATRSEIGWTLEIEVPFRTMNFNPDSDAWGINFQRHDCPQERSEPVDGLAAKPGAEQDEQCRAAHRHPECDPGSWPRREAVRGRHVRVVPRTWRLQRHERRECRRRPLLQSHAAAQGQPHRQHRLRAGGSRCAPGQPHTLLALVPRKARFLPRRLPLLRFRERGGAGWRQGARAATISFLSSAAGSGSTSGIRRSGSISAAS